MHRANVYVFTYESSGREGKLLWQTRVKYSVTAKRRSAKADKKKEEKKETNRCGTKELQKHYTIEPEEPELEIIRLTFAA